ncbi:hypothetical protein [Nocardia sp. NPDC020380]|uniref:hypothetical protein n=1 Tax=Nocardia sp. NPDC020380 TaxID=3364309 RepID=UPI0037AC4762
MTVIGWFNGYCGALVVEVDVELLLELWGGVGDGATGSGVHGLGGASTTGAERA